MATVPVLMYHALAEYIECDIVSYDKLHGDKHFQVDEG